MDIIILKSNILHKLTRNFDLKKKQNEAEEEKWNDTQKELTNNEHNFVNNNNKKHEFSLINLLKLNTLATTTTTNQKRHNKAQVEPYNRRTLKFKQQQQISSKTFLPITTTPTTTNIINHKWNYCSISIAYTTTNSCITPPAKTTTPTKTSITKNNKSKKKCHKNNFKNNNSIKILLKTTKNINNNNNINKKNKNNNNKKIYYWHTPYRLTCGGKSRIYSKVSTSILLSSISLFMVLCLFTTTTTATKKITTTKTTISNITKTITTTKTMSTITNITATTTTTLPTIYASNNNNNNNNNSIIKNWYNREENFNNNLLNETFNIDHHPQRMLKREAANSPTDIDDSNYDEDFDEYDALIRNKSAKGKYIGAPCNEMKCEPSLLHVTCDKTTLTCGCEKNYPVQLGLIKGCDKPKKLGEQCFYDETCMYSDENSLCVQVRHNALCQCAHGFHSVSYMKPTKRVFCTQDLQEINRTDFPTLLGVASGIAVLAGLICMVLHLFSKTKYPRNRNFADHHGAPPIMYSSDTGIPLTVQSGRPSSRSSIRSSGSIGSYGNRRASSTGGVTDAGHGVSGVHAAKGIMVSTSRTGAARTAAILLISCHISAISKQNSRASSRQTSGAGCSAQSQSQSHSRDTINENGGIIGINDAHVHVHDHDHDHAHAHTSANYNNMDNRIIYDNTLAMTQTLQKQLNQQRQLLNLELSPARTKNLERFRTLLGINGIDHNLNDDDDNNHSNPNHFDDGNNQLQLSGPLLPTPASNTPRFAVKQTKLAKTNAKFLIIIFSYFKNIQFKFFNDL